MPAVSTPKVKFTLSNPGTANAPSEYDVAVQSDTIFGNKVYDGWCISAAAEIHEDTQYDAKVYSSYELDSLRTSVPVFNNNLLDKLDSVNWLVNHYTDHHADYTYGEVQAAIWKLMGDDWKKFTETLGTISESKINKLYDDAIAHDGFVPEAGQKLAVVLSPEGEHCQQYQPIIIETCAAQIGDRVWEDENANGRQDAGENGIAGAIVELVRDSNYDGKISANEVISKTTTDAKGEYAFKGLTLGLDYQVRFTKPDGFVEQSPRHAGTDKANDSDGLLSDVVVLTPGENNQSIDSGFYRNTASIGDRVWNDANQNGVQDAGEAGVANVAVTLLDQAGKSLKSMKTDANGNYQFKDLPAGKYQVAFAKPDGFNFTQPNTGNDKSDSDANVTTGQTAIIDLKAGEDNTDVDAGIFKPTDCHHHTGEIGDRFWYDTNQNGIQDAGEAGVANATVHLYGKDGLFLKTTTDANGNYRFKDLEAGNYKVEFKEPSGYQFTKQNAGGNDAKDSDADPSAGTNNGTTGTIALKAGEVRLDVDGGIFKPADCHGTAEIGDRFWYDTNKNGIQDAGEAGVPNATVHLYGKDNLFLKTTTDANGNYRFKNLEAGNYKVEFKEPSGYQFTKRNAGGNDANDSDADPSTGTNNGTTGVISLKAGQVRLDVDGGIHKKTAEVGDRFWYDTNKNGIQDAGEAGVPNATVHLYGKDNLLLKTKTDANGNYRFKDLQPGNYKVEFKEPEGYQFTKRDAGGDNTKDSDADPAKGANNGTTASFKLEAGDVKLDVDAGIYKDEKGEIGDRFWYDTNKNGIQDAGEAGVPNATVHLYGKNNLFLKTTTDANGHYSFKNLDAGNYKVEFKEPAGYQFTKQNAGGNDAKDSDASAASGNDNGTTGVIALKAGEKRTDVDGGIFKTEACDDSAQIGDRFWYDNNKNGMQDAGEPGVANATVHLYGKGGALIAKTTTDSNGNYRFKNLEAGKYQVEFKEPAGYQFTKQNAGDDNRDSDASPAGGNNNGTTGIITLAHGEVNLSIDAGIYKSAAVVPPVVTPPVVMPPVVYPPVVTPPVVAPVVKGSIKGFVFNDRDGDGTRDSNETTGPAKLRGGGFVELRDGSDKLVAKVPYDGKTGAYEFKDLDAGRYHIWLQSKENHFWVNLGQGEHMNVNIAVTSPIAIDLNGDGIQTIDLDDSQGSFDLFNNGTPVKSGWISGQDGLLVVDNNHDGKINDMSELFGGMQAGQGFAKLASYDSNQDGMVNQLDALFANLSIWQDVNGNHQTDAGELMTLAEAGVAGMKTGYSVLPEIDANGNLHLERSSAILADGSTVDMTDVYFQVNAADATAANVELPSFADLLSGSASMDKLLGEVMGPVAVETIATESTNLDVLSQLTRLYDQQALMV